VRSREDVLAAIEALREVGRRARVYASMPVIEGITPKLLLESPNARTFEDIQGLRRVEGIFRLDEIGLSPLDHATLYGDGAFEGILIRNRSIFLYREHMDRLDRSLDAIAIELPASRVVLTQQILKTARAADLPEGNGYIRLVVTRGVGDLGINPAKCVAPTVFAIISTIRLYSREAYGRGIKLGLARHVRRPDRTILDPNIKSLNYLNNVLALLEGTKGRGLVEALQLTKEGFIAEATVDNLFVVRKHAGWESDPAKVEVMTPSSEYCLVGITRETVLRIASRRGYKVTVRADLLPIDLVGPGKECFMTGTGAGVMPITAVEDVTVGDGVPGPVTIGLVEDLQKMMTDPACGISMDLPDNLVAEALANGVATNAGR
jgi:branched-chain amino acid aminotransferase